MSKCRGTLLQLCFLHNAEPNYYYFYRLWVRYTELPYKLDKVLSYMANIFPPLSHHQIDTFSCSHSISNHTFQVYLPSLGQEHDLSGIFSFSKWFMEKPDSMNLFHLYRKKGRQSQNTNMKCIDNASLGRSHRYFYSSQEYLSAYCY